MKTQDTITPEQALLRTTSLCAGSEHCIHQIMQKLLSWGLSEEQSDKIIDHLVKEKYIDEERFCHAFARDKMRYNHWGRQKIDQAMYLLELPAIYRRQALQELPEEEYLDILKDILASKARSTKARNNYERNGKLIRFALSRGFEMSLIRQCLPESEAPEDDPFEED